jgi:hypothetical protein
MMTPYKPFETSERNKKLRTFLNNWQKSDKSRTIKGKHDYARPYIPTEINGKMYLMCPDHGHKIEIPKKILNKFDDAN